MEISAVSGLGVGAQVQAQAQVQKKAELPQEDPSSKVNQGSQESAAKVAATGKKTIAVA